MKKNYIKEEKKMSTIQLISFANANHPGLENFKKSVEKHQGWDLVLLGENTEWKGWTTRMTCYRDHCYSLPPDQIIVLCDAYDVLCLRDSVNFLTSFKNMVREKDAKIVVGVETGCDFINCYPPKEYWKKYDVDLKSTRKFVNAGFVAGHASAIGDMWDWCIKSKFEDDQYGVGAFVDAHLEEVVMDLKSDLVFNDERAEMNYTFDKNGHELIYENQRLRPYFVHFPGLCISNSVPFYHLFKSELFQVGKNYKIVGQAINGEQEHITHFPPDRRGLVLGTTIEQGVFIGLVTAFTIVFIFAICFYAQRKRQKNIHTEK
jgi:hypothetical protein